ncbi:NAD(P)-dependent oxidoreductase [Micromonospora sp. WMMD812]|uniref:NAD-dependent epimerase/dehydratase family protein n=1 Tax=Micromonospora sp. WMMD812 TaxID=3015152 RepID=UPI00248B2821|nr:NAD(P)-dependent oxidoreductase [Micromonospora sp. WMMD812]WBB69022.1 NAD(P)-dependent oxidoreductase [Micromonospora sp. WMMD812]
MIKQGDDMVIKQRSHGEGADGRLRVVVLGGTGFLGQPICRRLADHGHQVVAVARNPRDLGGDVAVRALDLADARVEDIAALLRDVDADVVVNAAGGMWGLTDEQMVAVNVTLVEHLVAAAALLPRPVRLVQLGSVHEYGLVPVGASMPETMPPAPVMPYGEFKVRCTEVVAEAHRQGAVEGVTLRIGNVIGAGQPGHSLLGVVAGKLRAAQLAGGRARLELAPLGSQRDFVGLDEVVAAVVLAATRPGIGGHVINIGRGVAASARDMVHLLIDASEVPTDLVEAERTGPAETTWQRLDIALAAELLGWAPSDDLHTEMKQLWEHSVARVPA